MLTLLKKWGTATLFSLGRTLYKKNKVKIRNLNFKFVANTLTPLSYSNIMAPLLYGKKGGGRGAIVILPARQPLSF
jgi:hypothetical protein